jgi:hypothetical protein
MKIATNHLTAAFHRSIMEKAVDAKRNIDIDVPGFVNQYACSNWRPYLQK